MKTLKTIIWLALLGLSTIGKTQTFSKHSLKIAAGIGFNDNRIFSGMGTSYLVGYQKEIEGNRLRFSGNFRIGQFSTELITDGGEHFFTAKNLEALLNVDAVKLGSFSFVVGAGIFGSRVKGMRTYENREGNQPQITWDRTTYDKFFEAGGTFIVGFRFNNPNKRTVINVLPITVQAGTNNYLNYAFRVDLDFKF